MCAPPGLVHFSLYCICVYTQVGSVFTCMIFLSWDSNESLLMVCDTSHTSYSHTLVLCFLRSAEPVLVKPRWIKKKKKKKLLLVCSGLLDAVNGNEIRTVNCEEMSFYLMLSQRDPARAIHQEITAAGRCKWYILLEADSNFVCIFWTDQSVWTAAHSCF